MADTQIYPACKGRNCGCTDGVSHSPECRQDNDDACDGVLGNCSVPMWMNGCPAGTCERKAYGERPPSRMWMNYSAGYPMREDGRYSGYVPGLACPRWPTRRRQMSIPLPNPDCRLPMDGPPRYRADQMHAHAAAVTAAKDAEIAALRKVLWKIVYLRPDIEHPPLHSEAEGIRILARAALGDKNG